MPASGQRSRRGGAHLVQNDVPATEWPIFGCVFYLAATEGLQEEWERSLRHADPGTDQLRAADR